MNGPSLSNAATTMAEESQTQKLSRALTARLAHLQKASLAESEAFLESLRQSGDIVLDFLPEDDDLPLVDEEAEMDSDGDFFLDEDAPFVERDANESMDIPNGDSPFAPEGGYAIRVIVGTDGNARCVPPENTWAAAHGKPPLGTMALDFVSKRIQVLSDVAVWLERRFGERLRLGLNAFLAGWTPVKQQVFLSETGRDPKKDKGPFSSSIQNVRLFWPEGSIPLSGCVFRANAKHG